MSTRQKKLYRLENEKKIGGICAGISDIYNVDVTAVRLVAVFLTVFTGFWPGIVTYLCGWYLIPGGGDKNENSQKTDTA